MNDDHHPAFSDVMKKINSDNPEHVDKVSIARFARFGFAERVEVLKQTDDLITADDGVDLRKKGQLLAHSRKLRDVHAVLTRARR